jgi:hypothetical protein
LAAPTGRRTAPGQGTGGTTGRSEGTPDSDAARDRLPPWRPVGRLATSRRKRCSTISPPPTPTEKPQTSGAGDGTRSQSVLHFFTGRAPSPTTPDAADAVAKDRRQRSGPCFITLNLVFTCQRTGRGGDGSPPPQTPPAVVHRRRRV